MRKKRQKNKCENSRGVSPRGPPKTALSKLVNAAGIKERAACRMD